MATKAKKTAKLHKGKKLEAQRPLKTAKPGDDRQFYNIKLVDAHVLSCS